MTAREGQSPAAGDTVPSAAPLRGAALAARLLENACAPGPAGDVLRLGVVRELARELRGELEALSTSMDVAGVEGVEGALRAADVANLAASALPDLPYERALEAAAAAHLAAGAARALSALAGAATRDLTDADHAPYALKDARGAAWRARLAVRQADEFLGE